MSTLPEALEQWASKYNAQQPLRSIDEIVLFGEIADADEVSIQRWIAQRTGVKAIRTVERWQHWQRAQMGLEPKRGEPGAKEMREPQPREQAILNELYARVPYEALAAQITKGLVVDKIEGTFTLSKKEVGRQRSFSDVVIDRENKTRYGTTLRELGMTLAFGQWNSAAEQLIELWCDSFDWHPTINLEAQELEIDTLEMRTAAEAYELDWS